MSGTAYQWSVARVFEAFPDAVARWDALESVGSDFHWSLGREANYLVENGVPAMTAYAAIGRRTGVKSQTVRKAYYTWRAFPDSVREEYHTVPYSVFRHAARYENPEEVLEYYVAEGGVSVEEIEQVFRIGEQDDEIEKPAFPRYVVGIVRRMLGLPPQKRQTAEALLRDLIALIEEGE